MPLNQTKVKQVLVNNRWNWKDSAGVSTSVTFTEDDIIRAGNGSNDTSKIDSEKNKIIIKWRSAVDIISIISPDELKGKTGDLTITVSRIR
jgi:hypothetical protein